MTFETVWDILFPTRCQGCETPLRHGAVLCASCLEKIPRYSTLFCAVCLARLPEGKMVCHTDAPYHFGAAADFGNPTVRALVHALKFRSARRAAEPLADLLVDYARAVDMPWKNALVIPIPLGSRRERSRGFNQAELIAKIFAERLGLELLSGALVRTRETSAQSETSGAAERRTNIAGCFAVPRPERVADRAVLLIDDVRTSGATLAETAKALKDAGASPRYALTAARA